MKNYLKYCNNEDSDKSRFWEIIIISISGFRKHVMPGEKLHTASFLKKPIPSIFIKSSVCVNPTDIRQSASFRRAQLDN
jgi:hypothetical protein